MKSESQQQQQRWCEPQSIRISPQPEPEADRFHHDLIMISACSSVKTPICYCHSWKKGLRDDASAAFSPE